MTDQNNTLFDNDVFLTDDDLENPEGLAAALIGEDKKYKTPDDLVKKVIHQDRHISNLEKENAEFRGKVSNEKTIETLLAAIKASSGNTGNDPAGNQGKEEPKTETLRPEEIVSKVLQELENKTIRQQQEQNLATVKATLVKAFGSQYASKLEEVAQEHSLSPDDLDALAKKSPKLLFKTLGITEQSVKKDAASLWNTPPTNTLVQQNSGSNTGVRDNSFYETLRMKDPKKFRSDEVQAARMRDALALGDRFFQPKT